jgi:hypothetical protein
MKVAHNPRHSKAWRMRELEPSIVSSMKLVFVFFELLHKFLSVCYHILAFMAVDIHTIFVPFITPFQLAEPTACSAF